MPSDIFFIYFIYDFVFGVCVCVCVCVYFFLFGKLGIMAAGLSKILSKRVTVMLFGALSSIGLVLASVSTSLPVLIFALLLTSK